MKTRNALYFWCDVIFSSIVEFTLELIGEIIDGLT